MSQAPRAKAFMVVAPFVLCALTLMLYFGFATLILTDKDVSLKDPIVASIVTLALRELLGVISIMVSHIYYRGKPLVDLDGDGKPDEVKQ